MGKINEFQRKQLASSAVGVAPADRSGQIVGSSIARVGSALATKEAAQLDKFTDMQANTAVMQFSLSFQKMAAQAQRKMANNPTGYPQEVFNDGQDMITLFGEGIADDIVRAKFEASAGTVLKAGTLQAGAWAFAKQAANATIAAEDALRLGTIAIGSAVNLQQLEASMATVKDLAFVDIPDEILGRSEKEATLRKNMPGSLKSYFSNQVVRAPEQLIKDLDAGKYDNVDFFTADMRKIFRSAAETRINKEKVRVKEAITDNYQQLVTQDLQDELDFATVDAFDSAKRPEDGITDLQANSLRKSLIRKAEADASLLERSTPAASQYVSVVFAAVDNRIDRAKALQLISDAYSDGIITREEGEFLRQTKANLQEIVTSRISNGLFRGASAIMNKIERTVFVRGKESTAATYIRDVVLQVNNKIPPDIATQNVLNKIDQDSVIEENPNLAAEKDPVDRAYELRAISMIKAGGKLLTDRNIQALKVQLRQTVIRQRLDREKKQEELDRRNGN